MLKKVTLTNLSPLDIMVAGKSYQWYFERANNSQTLVITAGDSWTWGVGLSDNACTNNRNFIKRTNCIYGNVLSSAMESDLINVGWPGLGNIHIIDSTFKVINRLIKNYKQIYVIFCLTESGRDVDLSFDSNNDMYENILRGPDWPAFDEIITHRYSLKKLKFALFDLNKSNVHFQYLLRGFLRATRSRKNVLDILDAYERTSFKMLVNEANKTRYSNIKYFVGRNFVSTFERNIPILTNNNIFYLPQRWTDIVALRGKITQYPKKVYAVTNLGIVPFFYFGQSRKLPGVVEKEQILKNSLLAIDWLESNPYCCESVAYPNQLAHQWWADYILENLHNG